MDSLDELTLRKRRDLMLGRITAPNVYLEAALFHYAPPPPVPPPFMFAPQQPAQHQPPLPPEPAPPMAAYHGLQNILFIHAAANAGVQQAMEDERRDGLDDGRRVRQRLQNIQDYAGGGAAAAA